MKHEYATLSNGLQIPSLGLGTWLIDNKEVAGVVRKGVELGYRHIDTAEAYENEEGVGVGIAESGIAREDLFVTTKVAAEHKTYDQARDAIDKSLARLGLNYVDLLLIHCPQPWDKFRGTERFFDENINVWRAMEEAYKDGKVKAIGVANFLEADLDNLVAGSDIAPMVNQVLAHVGNMPFDLINYCNDHNIVVEGYSPMGHGEVLDNEAILSMAEKYGVTPAQLCITYDLQHGLVALPKARSTEHLRNNLDTWTEGFEISGEDMQFLDTLHLNEYGESAIWPCYRAND